MSLWLKCNNDRKSTYTTTYQTSTTITSSKSVQASTTSSQTLYTTVETQNFWNSVFNFSHTVSVDACPISPEGICTIGNMSHSGKIIKYTTTYDDYSISIGDITAGLTAAYHTVTDTNHNYTTTTKTFSTSFANNNSSTSFSYTANMSTTCTGFLQDYSSSLNRSRSYGISLKYSANRKAKTSYWSTKTLTITTGNVYNSGTIMWYPNFDYQAPSHTHSATVYLYNSGTNKYSSSAAGWATNINLWNSYTITDPIVSKTYKSWWTTTSASTLTQRINVYTTKTTTENVNRKISTYTSTTSSRLTTCSSMYNLTLNTSTYSYTSSYLYLEMTGTSYWDPISISGSTVTYGSRSVSVIISIHNTSLPSNETLSYGSNATWSARFSYQSLDSTSLTTAWWWWGVYNNYVSLNSTNKTFSNYYIFYSATNTCSNPDYFKQNCSLRVIDQSLSMSYSFTHTEAAKISNLNSTVTLTTGNSTNSGTISCVDQLYSNSVLYSSSYHGQFNWQTSDLTTMFTNFSMTLSSTRGAWWRRTFTITNTYSVIEATTSQGTSMDTGTFQTTVTSIR